MIKFFHIAIFLGLIALSSSSSGTCKWTDPNTGDSYDFSSLSRHDAWKVTDMNTSQDDLFSIDFIFNFCKPIDGLCNGRANLAAYESLIVLGQATDACEILGTIDQMEVSAGTSMGLPGIKITYKGGEVCAGSDNPSQNGQPMYSTFNIICSPKKGDQFQQVHFNGETVTKCTPEFYINHPAGCVGGVYMTDYGVITWLIFIFLVYAIGGSLYNMKFKNKKGLDAFPNIDFWRKFPSNLKALPSVLQDLVSKIKQKFTKEPRPSPGSFRAAQNLTSGSKRAQYTLV